MDNKNYAFKILKPFGFELVEIEVEKITEEYTNIIPDYNLKKPIFNFDKQVWEEYDVTPQIAQIAYQQMTTQQTITNLQTQNAQMAYQLMTAQGGATV